jgi:uncharacterized membrane protein YfcA
VISALDAAALAAAGVAAGLVGSAGGITSMISYPALLAVGLPALPAGIANNVAIVACWPGSAVASRPELRDRAAWLRRWAIVAAVGGAAGASLLLVTPPGLFERVVPFLVAAGSLALLLEPRLAARRRRRGPAGGHPVSLPSGVLALALYNGYFGAGAGVMTLTLMLVLVDSHLPTANALKNMLIGAASLSCAAVLVVAGSVAWDAVAPLAVGMLAGSTLGPRVARRIPARVLRIAIVLFGLALAVELWIDPGS